MLSFLRNSLQGVAIKALMILLALTFILWGVGDMVTSGGGEPYVFKVGSETFTHNMWKQTVAKQIQHLNHTYGQQFSEEDLKKFGYFDNLVEQLINKSVLSQEAKRVGILVSDEMVKYEIATNPSFHDSTGKFSKELFESTLRQMGITENRFIETVKEDMAVSNLVQPFTSFNLPSPEFIEQINVIANTEREIELYELDANKISLSNKPTDQELQEILDSNQSKFSTPESREVSYFTFSIKDVDQNVDITEKELENQYKSKTYLFTKPENRTVSQLIFNDMDTALEAKKRIENGEKLASVGKNLKAINKETLIGTLTREGFDKEIGDAIFTTPDGKISMPVQSPMGIHLFQVDKIIPQKVKSFEEAKPTLRLQIKDEKLFERLSALAQHIDNEIINNKLIEEIADEHKFKLSRIKLVEPFEGKSSKKIEDSPAFRTTAFATDLNTLSMVTPYDEVTFFVIRVEKVGQKRVKTMDETKDQLITIWSDKRKSTMLEEMAHKLSDVIASNKPLSNDLLTVVTVKKLKLNRENIEALPNEFVDKIYQTQLKQTTAPFRGNGKYFVAKVIRLNKPSKQEIEKHKFESQVLYAQTQKEIYLKEYLVDAKKRYKITINYDYIR